MPSEEGDYTVSKVEIRFVRWLVTKILGLVISVVCINRSPEGQASDGDEAWRRLGFER